jgi:hypothetical protein
VERAKRPKKDDLLNSIEECMNLPLDSIARGMRARVRSLSWMHLRALERGFKLAYQEGYDRAELARASGDP